MRTLKLTLAYDGTNYAGWQFQPDQPTLQGTLERAICHVTGQPAGVLASGRTDAGVHALGQVVRCRTESRLPADVLGRALNAVLPRDMAVLNVAEAPDDFHPIRDVVRKRYRYVICDGPVRDVFQLRYSWHHVYGRLDAEAMQRAAAPLRGTHDFRSFQSSGAERQTSVRTIFDLLVERGRGGRENFVDLEVAADGFLYNMVRALVGTLVQVGNGSRSEDWPGEVLRAADRRVAGPTAPPQGLLLLKVDYGEAAG
jgi:tRNA pseudouridine38-40 synthase